MRRFLLPVCICLAVGILPAQEDADFSKAMKTIGKSMNTLKGLEAKTGPEAAESAQKAADAFRVTEKYWTAHSTSDAAKWTQESIGHAEALAAAAKAGETEKANAAYKSLGGTCKGCHEAHREKQADGAYKIK